LVSLGVAVGGTGVLVGLGVAVGETGIGVFPHVPPSVPHLFVPPPDTVLHL